MVIIMASSWAGRPSLLKGERMLSSPAVRLIGDVVRVSREAARINRDRRRKISVAASSPSREIPSGPSSSSISPGIVNSWTKKVMASKTQNPRRPCRKTRAGSRVRATEARTGRAASPRPCQSAAASTDTAAHRTATTFVRGSSRCSSESPGKY